MKKSLTSVGFKVLALWCTIIVLGMSYMFIFVDKNWNVPAIIFLIIVLLFCIFGVYLTFNHSIKIKNGFLIIKQVKKQIIPIEDIQDIYLNDEIGLQPMDRLQ